MYVDSQISSGKESGCEEMAPSKSFWLKKRNLVAWKVIVTMTFTEYLPGAGQCVEFLSLSLGANSHDWRFGMERRWRGEAIASPSLPTRSATWKMMKAEDSFFLAETQSFSVWV